MASKKKLPQGIINKLSGKVRKSLENKSKHILLFLLLEDKELREKAKASA